MDELIIIRKPSEQLQKFLIKRIKEKRELSRKFNSGELNYLFKLPSKKI